ncbi:MAG: hypothetical protein ACLUD0_09505 [Eubacterium ramulus]
MQRLKNRWITVLTTCAIHQKGGVTYGRSRIKGGMLTTVQDLGRTGYQSQGFGVSGVMDVRSFKIANLLLDNPENEAVLEFTLMESNTLNLLPRPSLLSPAVIFSHRSTVSLIENYTAALYAPR